MNEISFIKRSKVVKMFLRGLSYDDIARQIGIGKGSVVNIIKEFREGDLAVPSDMTEYVDALRKIAVDLGKNNTSFAQVQSCLKLDAKLREMGVNCEQAEPWLDICRDIASPTVSSGQFVAAALELAKLEALNGLTYGGVIADYDAKLKRSSELDREIEQKQERLSEVVLKHEQEKEQATSELNSITK
ncbi:MAG: helix-turn-helix domain-containing protein, partial [Deltaproteobacteria bacterium]|nr:helix-turn-helix domain-containing protein [Deltaproteobacteria bacterium]